MVSIRDVEKVNANKSNYESKKIEDVSKMTLTIRVVSIIIIVIMSIIIFKINKKRKR